MHQGPQFFANSPAGIALQIVQHCPIAVLKYQMELLVPLEHLDETDKIRVSQLLEGIWI